MRSFLVSITRNPLSLTGVAIATASAALIITLFAVEVFGYLGNPYIGILAYLVFPALFAFGLLLIPVGIVQERKRARRAVAKGEPPPRFPVVDLNVERTRKRVLGFVLLTVANIVVLSVATYKGVEVMESNEFCGETCHSVMTPEYTAYQRSSHARVRCVECHIGPGADWFVKSKLSGAWQVASVAFDLYPRPIPTPVHDLRPARETCEQCHWPTKFVGDRLRVYTHFASDEANTELKTILMLRVGGSEGIRSHGIHWHVDPRIRVRYRSDESRETIYEVEFTDADGTTRVYLPADGAPPEAERPLEWRVMDCVDCHNRPSHVFMPPEKEVDLALERGLISRTLPFIRREGVRVLRGDYASREEAVVEIPAAVASYYRSEHPEVAAARGDEIEAAGKELAHLYTANVFPSMGLTWGTYPNFIGHEISDGCFRCHNDEHVTSDGEVISQDCSTCHALLAMEEENPEILEMLRP